MFVCIGWISFCIRLPLLEWFRQCWAFVRHYFAIVSQIGHVFGGVWDSGYLLSYSRFDSPDYLYYSTASPWLQVKLLQILQHFSPPSDVT